MDFLGTPIGYIMELIYNLVSNYGLTIIIISILFKIIILPLTVKQQKSMAAMQQIQPIIAEIQKKYANDKEKQSTEIMKIYKEYNVSPFASCLPTLIQFPILIGLYGAIAKPLTFMLGYGSDIIAKLGKIVGVAVTGSPYSYEIKIATLASKPEFLDKVASAVNGFKPLDFSFLGLDLSAMPTISFIDSAWILPICAAILTYLSSYFMQKDTKTSDEMQSSQKMMTYFMPVMILFFGFQVPTGLSLYWCINSILQIVQYFTLDKSFKKQLAAEIAVKSVSTENKKKKKG